MESHVSEVISRYNATMGTNVRISAESTKIVRDAFARGYSVDDLAKAINYYKQIGDKYACHRLDCCVGITKGIDRVKSALVKSGGSTFMKPSAYVKTCSTESKEYEYQKLPAEELKYFYGINQYVHQYFMNKIDKTPIVTTLEHSNLFMEHFVTKYTEEQLCHMIDDYCEWYKDDENYKNRDLWEISQLFRPVKTKVPF